MTNNQNNTLDIKKFGINLWKIRTERGMSREALADAVGLADQRIVYDYENGIKRPKLERALSIAMALGVALDSMFR